MTTKSKKSEAAVASTVATAKVKKTVAKPTFDSEKDREAAKSAGVSLVFYRILRAIKDSKPHSYRQIEAKTGYYANLTATMRAQHEGSMASEGLVKEEVMDIDGKDKIVFTITKKGLKILGK